MSRSDTRPVAAIVAAVLVALLATSSAAVAQVKDHEKIDYPPLPEFDVPQPTTFTLENGMRVFLMEDRELPLVRIDARIRTGSHWEPAEKVGLASLFGQVWREGGTTSRPADALDAWLAERAASIETSVGGTFGSAGLNVLVDDFDAALEVFEDVLRHPAFAEDRLEVAKSQARSAIARRNDDIGGIVAREFRKLIYGEDSPIARTTEYATIAAITRDDLVAWHERFIHPNNILLGVIGDFDASRMRAKIEQAFADWPKGPELDLPPIPYREEPRPGVFFVEKSDVTQANIRMGHLGIERDNPDYFAVTVLNEVMSGGFTSRLFNSIRTEKGLAYSVFGSVGSSYLYPGTFTSGMQTASENMARAVEALEAELVGLRENPPTEVEIERAKTSIRESSVFSYASRAQILGQQLTYAYYGLPSDYLDTFFEKVESVPRDRVVAAAQKYLRPEEFTLLVVGKAEDFDRPLSTFGEVQEIDIAIPEPPDTAPKAEKTAETLERGMAIAKRALDAMGGEAYMAVETVRQKLESTIEIQGQKIKLGQAVTAVLPDRFHIEVSTPMGGQTVVLDGDAGFMKAQGQVRDLPPDAVTQQRAQMMRSADTLIREVGAPGFEAVFVERSEAAGTPCDLVAVTYGEIDTQLCVDDDGRILSQSYQDRNPMTGEPGRVTNLYSDFREVDGIVVPFKAESLFAGEPFGSTVTLEYEIGLDVDPALFEKP